MLGLCFHLGDHNDRHAAFFTVATWGSLALSFGVTDLFVITQKPDLLEGFGLDPARVLRLASPHTLKRSPEFKDVPLVQLVTKNHDVPMQDLRDFKHPEDAIYVVGGEKNGCPENLVDNETSGFVYIPTVAGRSLWAQQAASVVLWDRSKKEGV